MASRSTGSECSRPTVASTLTVSPPYPIEQILIACALEEELTVLRRCLPDSLQFLQTGLGWNRSRRRLEQRIRQRRPSAIIFSGTAGQLDPGVKLGTVIFPECWCFGDGRCHEQSSELIPFLAARGFPTRGVGLTVSRPVLREGRRLSLHAESHALICDMESAGILAAARDLQISTLALKVVSDTANSGSAGYWKEFTSNMERLGKYLGQMIRVISTNEAFAPRPPEPRT